MTQRPIKFRAWDKITKKMFYRSLEEMADKAWVPLEGWGEYFSNPMQFTGLHDKNGTPVWEGDTVEWDEWHDNIDTNQVHKDEVTYDVGTFWLGTSIPLHEMVGEKGRLEVRVTGNIYEQAGKTK